MNKLKKDWDAYARRLMALEVQPQPWMWCLVDATDSVYRPDGTRFVRGFR